MTLFRPGHRRLLRVLHPAEAGSYAEVLAGLGVLLENEVLPLSPRFDDGRLDIGRARSSLFGSGLCQIPFDRSVGGLGLPFSVYCLGMELVGSAEASVAMSMAIHNTVSEAVQRFGDRGQVESLLPDLVRGRRLAAFSLTEATSGSDAKTMGTTARRARGGGYTLDGSKMFITNAGEADVYLVFARGDGGPSAFLVEKGAEGLSFGEDIPKLGMKGTRTSEVLLRGCRVGAGALLGSEGEGLEYAKQLLNSSRVVMGAVCVGIAQAAYQRALEYGAQRRVSGRPLSEFQLTREKIADMITGINAARSLYLYAARLRDSGEGDFSSEAAQAKVFCAETAIEVCDDAIQIFGGYGYTGPEIHRHWRDARLLTIGEGTSEILRLLVARKELSKLR